MSRGLGGGSHARKTEWIGEASSLGKHLRAQDGVARSMTFLVNCQSVLSGT